jgi:hypothetical protein
MPFRKLKTPSLAGRGCAGQMAGASLNTAHAATAKQLLSVFANSTFSDVVYCRVDEMTAVVDNLFRRHCRVGLLAKHGCRDTVSGSRVSRSLRTRFYSAELMKDGTLKLFERGADALESYCNHRT